MTLRVQLIIPAASNVPADVATNTFHFQPEDPNPEDYGPAIGTLLDELFTDSFSTVGTLQGNYTNQTVSNAWRFAIWDLDQSAPRVPTYEANLAISPGTGQALPRDVAVVSSFQAQRVSGGNQARRRNRVFLGPLGTTPLAAGGQVSGNFRTLVSGVFQRMWVSAEAGGVVHWVGYSPTDEGLWEIDNGWVDNEFDTQRRRGGDPSARTTWNAVLP